MIRPYEDADLPEVLAILRQSLGTSPTQPRSEDWFRWKHLDNPFGRSIMFVASVDERLAGFRAFLRWKLCTAKGETLDCARPVDTATHPDFRRMGIFQALTEHAVDAARTEAIDLVFNTPNSRSGAGYRKMGWTEVGPIGVMVRPSPRALLAPFRDASPGDLLSFVDGQQATEVSGPVESDTAGLHTPRTARYLRWRFVDNPVARYVKIEADGGTAMLRPNLRRGLREVVISDVWGPDTTGPMRRAVRASRGDYVIGSFPPVSRLRRAARRAGLFPVPGVTALSVVALPLRQLAVDTGDIARWRLTMSDLELL